MKTNQRSILYLFIASTLLLSACSPAAVSAPLPTQGPTEAPLPTESPTATIPPPTPSPEPDTHLSVDVPELERKPVIDGTINPEEWEGAYQAELSGGGELLLMAADGYLYLGLRGDKEPVASICLDRGDQVAVLHSSAALGTALYEPGENEWQQVQAFSWQCRDTTDSESAKQERETFLAQEGWVASNGRMGAADEVEYQIAMPDGRLRLVVSSIGAPGYDNLSMLPGETGDDCENVQLLTGPIPEQVQFLMDNWMTVIVEP